MLCEEIFLKVTTLSVCTINIKLSTFLFGIVQWQAWEVRVQFRDPFSCSSILNWYVNVQLSFLPHTTRWCLPVHKKIPWWNDLWCTNLCLCKDFSPSNQQDECINHMCVTGRKERHFVGFIIVGFRPTFQPSIVQC